MPKYARAGRPESVDGGGGGVEVNQSAKDAGRGGSGDGGVCAGTRGGGRTAAKNAGDVSGGAVGKGQRRTNRSYRHTSAAEERVLRGARC